MQEEISLREIIEILLKGKYIIIVTTIIAMLLSAVVSFFVLSPTYEATATVRIPESTESLKSYTQTLQDDASLNRVITKLKLADTYTLTSMRNAVSLETVDETSIIRIKVKGEDPATITNITNLLAYELGARAEIFERSVRIVSEKNQIEALDDNIAVIQTSIQNIQQQLQETPEKLITKRTLADDPYMQSVVSDSGTLNNREAGALELTVESINPLYAELESKLANKVIELNDLLEQQKVLQQNVDEDVQSIEQLEQQMDEERLKSTNAERMLDGLQTVLVSPALQPSEPIGPRKAMNVAIAMVLGVMISVLFVFFREYWKNTSTNTTN